MVTDQDDSGEQSPDTSPAETPETKETPAVAEQAEIQAPAELQTSDNAFLHFEAVLKRFDDLDGRLNELAGMRKDVFEERENHAQQDSQVLELQAELETAWRENEELRHQNEHLAAELANSSVEKTVKTSIGLDESLSWEDRKAMIMAQMEEDSFDAEEFVSSLSNSVQQSSVVQQTIHADSMIETDDPDSATFDAVDPRQFVEALVEQLERLQDKIRAREDEIKELQNLLQNQADTRAGGIAIGAAAIADLVDSDELVIEERERLQQLKNDWEDKFRQSEIDASLERAKLSRERQELAKRAQQLEEQIEDLQREKRGRTDVPTKGSRWMAELGLGGEKTED